MVLNKNMKVNLRSIRIQCGCFLAKVFVLKQVDITVYSMRNEFNCQ